ncbi:ZIP family metal transporter [Herbaspirillum lusitanum]|uniref:ZIP family metal transporter n=1 Tax=Herbaspirillum lusitanum TaxID=213312 RepID=UPI0022376C07|nr:ZIP family metal transporter [Herbaspirillum lusitanum]MCW5297023.1 ZIP family metal transporter [Herbaspirillum lusitanum]
MIQAQLREQFPVEPTPAAAPAPSHPGFWAGLRLRQIAMLAVALVFVLVKSYESLQAFFLTHPEVKMALLGSSAAAGLTALGALGVLFTRRISERTQDVLLGYGGGIMLAASVFSLIIPAMNQAQALGYEKTGAVLLTATGIMLGGLFVLAINHLIPHQHFIAPNPAIQTMRTSRIWMFVMAVTIHNFPEGLAIGVGFGGDDMGKAIALATGIGIQDIPEGLVVALALRTLGYSPWKSAGAGILSGLVEPIGGVLGALATGVSATALPWALAGAGGAMLFVISHEVIPESHRQGHETQATLGLLAGFVTMMLLDTLLG